MTSVERLYVQQCSVSAHENFLSNCRRLNTLNWFNLIFADSVLPYQSPLRVIFTTIVAINYLRTSHVSTAECLNASGFSLCACNPLVAITVMLSYKHRKTSYLYVSKNTVSPSKRFSQPVSQSGQSVIVDEAAVQDNHLVAHPICCLKRHECLVD